jgi:transcriptional regulator with XRE-family HTH domain
VQVSDLRVFEGRPTLADVAQLAGVSPATVSRVLTGSAQVTSGTRGAPERDLHDLDTSTSQHRVKGGGELPSPIADREPETRAMKSVLSGQRQPIDAQ